MKRLAALFALAAACDSPPSGGSGGDTDAAADADGYLLMLRTDTGTPSISLLDPATGRSSSEAYFVLGGDPRAVIDVAPGGRRVAWIAAPQGGALPQIRVAEATTENGRPALKLVRAFDGVPADLVRWNPDGDRVFTRHVWLDPATGAAHDCIPPGVGRPESFYPSIVALPGGRRYVCPESQALFDDGRRVADAIGGDVDRGAADGQWYGAPLHVASLTRRSFAQGMDDPAFAPGLEVPAALATGGWIRLPRGQAADAPLFDPVAWFERGETGPAGAWPLAGALTPFSGAPEPVGVADDGAHLLYAVRSAGDTALVEVARDGATRAFRAAEVGATAVPEGPPARPLALGDGDWLLPIGDGAWLGWLDGRPVHLPDAGLASPDAGLFVASRAGEDGVARVCVRALEDRAVGEARCFVPDPQGVPLAVMARGAKAAGPPLILDVNRLAAWPGSPVTVTGARFGPSGTVKVGGVAVPAGDVVGWSDDRVVFTMSEALPASGEVRVENATGADAGPRRFWLHRTALAASPFAGVTADVIPVAQGLNPVDLGGLEAFEAAAPDDLALNAAARAPDGRHVVWSAGSAAPERRTAILRDGPYERHLDFALGAGLADPARWQLVFRTELDLAMQRPAFHVLAGDLVERVTRLHPEAGERFTFAAVRDRLPFGDAITLGLPDFFRPAEGGTLTVNQFALEHEPWTLGLLTGWRGPDGAWGTPVHAEAPRTVLPHFFRGAAADGDLVLATGFDPLGTAGAAFAFSRDGGRTFDAPTLVAEATAPFREPVLVRAARGPFFLVVEASYNAPQLLGVHAIAPDGTLTLDVAEAPPGQLDGGLVRDAPVTVASEGGRVAMHFAAGRALAVIDFDAGAPAWNTTPGVVSVFDDPATRDLYAVLEDGAVRRATAAGRWADWAPVDLDFDLALPTRVVPAALGRLPDGRLVVFALLRTPDDAAPSPLARAGFLVAPPP